MSASAPSGVLGIVIGLVTGPRFCADWRFGGRLMTSGRIHRLHPVLTTSEIVYQEKKLKMTEKFCHEIINKRDFCKLVGRGIPLPPLNLTKLIGVDKKI